MHSQSCVEKRLHRLTRKLDATVIFDLYIIARRGLTLCLLRCASLLIALGNFLARGREVALVLCVVGVIEPEADVFDIEVEAGGVQRVDQSPLQIFEVCLLAALRPPIFEHSLIIITSDQELTVQEGDFQLLQSNINARIEALVRAAPEPLDLVATVSLDEEGPEFIVEDLHVDAGVLALLHVRVDVLGLLLLNGARTVQVLAGRVLLAQILATRDWAWVSFGEVIFVVPELSLGSSAIKLVIKQEILVFF